MQSETQFYEEAACPFTYQFVIHLWFTLLELTNQSIRPSCATRGINQSLFPTSNKSHFWIICDIIITYLWHMVMYLWLTCDKLCVLAVTHLWPYYYPLTTVFMWNFFENCMKFPWKLCEIFKKVEWISLKNWVKFSLKLSEILSRIV